MFCTNCGSDTRGARFCPSCGIATSSHPTVGPPGEPGLTPSAPAARSIAPIALCGAAVAIVIVLLAAIAFILHDNGRDSPPVHTASPPAALPATGVAAAATSAPTSQAPATRHHAAHRSRSSGPGDVRILPAGLFCRDLYARGYSYSASVDYWREHGQSNQMDVDRNGIPCETVYPPTDVTDYWGQSSLPTPDALAAGLFCRDLYARGYSYGDAVDYWNWYGEPAQMDADLNGIPCETVYPTADVDAYWYG